MSDSPNTSVQQAVTASDHSLPTPSAFGSHQDSCPRGCTLADSRAGEIVWYSANPNHQSIHDAQSNELPSHFVILLPDTCKRAGYVDNPDYHACFVVSPIRTWHHLTFLTCRTDHITSSIDLMSFTSYLRRTPTWSKSERRT